MAGNVKAVCFQEYISYVGCFVLIPVVIILTNPTMKSYAKNWIQTQANDLSFACVTIGSNILKHLRSTSAAVSPSNMVEEVV